MAKLKTSFEVVFIVFTVSAIYQHRAQCCRSHFLRNVRNAFHDLFHDTNDISEAPKRVEEVEKAALENLKKKVQAKILPDSEYVKNRNEDYAKYFWFYSDHTGCYEEGLSTKYRGKMAMTESHRKCANWSFFTSLIRIRMNNASQRIEANRFSLTYLERTDEEKELYGQDLLGISIVNDTLNNFAKEGHVFHNYCRDPDNVGRPWCFVKGEKGPQFDYCPVPRCTPCWRIRLKSLARFGQIGINTTQMWTPRCTSKGDFANRQCWENYCWCSTISGFIVPDSLRIRSKRINDCAKFIKEKENLSRKESKQNTPSPQRAFEQGNQPRGVNEGD